MPDRLGFRSDPAAQLPHFPGPYSAPARPTSRLLSNPHFLEAAALVRKRLPIVATVLCWSHSLHSSSSGCQKLSPELPQVPSIQQSAALALGRLANYNDDLAEAVVGNGILPQLVYSLSEKNRSPQL